MEPETAQEVFARHGQALAAADLDAVAGDYAEDAVFITPDGVLHGRAAIREAFAQFFAALPNATLETKAAVFEEDLLLLVWAADSDAARIENAVDMFVFSDGLIRAHTATFE